MAEIIVTVKPDGSTVIEVKGVKGQSCKDLTKFLESSLGVVAETSPTAEYFEELEVKEHATVSNGK